jgi:hypothetical protein
LRPFQVNKNKKNREPVVEKTQYEQQVELKKRLRTMLENEKLIPRVGIWCTFVVRESPADRMQELIFLTRCQRMMQANNQVCRRLGARGMKLICEDAWVAFFQGQPYGQGEPLTLMPSFTPRIP